MKIPDPSLPPLLQNALRDGYAIHFFEEKISLVFGAEETVCCLTASKHLDLDRCIMIAEAIQCHRRYRRAAGHRLAAIMTPGVMGEHDSFR